MTVGGSESIQVAFDIGGTFTDVLISSSDGEMFPFKVLSKQDEIAGRVAACVREVLSKKPGSIVAGIYHGTTICSNAVIENKRAITGYLTTQGFRDDVSFPRPQGEVSRDVMNLFFPPTTPLVPRRMRVEVAERTSADGAIERPLDVSTVEAALDRLLAQDIEALAICLVNAHANPAHEIAVAEIARRRAPGLAILTSHEISPSAGEYERASTTILHASLAPVVERYLARLEQDLAGYPELVVMQANGGVVPARHARQRPANLIESGPAAGVLAAAALASECGIEHAIALDMGGTTVKVCLIENGRPRETMHMEVSLDTAGRLAKGAGHALLASGFDLVEIGAGGGSIAWIDAGGALRVGPESAGASPGPACYGLGGDRPTISDAAVALGYLNPVAIAGGTVPISPNLAARAIERDIAGPANMTVPQAAEGICRVAVASMRRAVRMVTVQRGCDPRQCSLIAFGGASPLLAAALAQELEIGTVYVPPQAGLFCALGLLTADHRFDAIAPYWGRLDETPEDTLLQEFQRMTAKAAMELSASGLDLDTAMIERSIDLRYPKQNSPITVRVPDDLAAIDLPAYLAEAFHCAHGVQYGHDHRDSPVMATALRLRIVLPTEGFKLGDADAGLARTGASGAKDRRMAWFDGAEHPVPIYTRGALSERAAPGPAIVEDFDTTIVTPPGWNLRLGPLGSVVLERLDRVAGEPAR